MLTQSVMWKLRREGGGGGCFFFQAEDGIRDTSVTGVQTCALPIFPADNQGYVFANLAPVRALAARFFPVMSGDPELQEIGRASCRERV